MSELQSNSVSSLVDIVCDDSNAASERQDAYGFLATRLRDASEVEKGEIISEISVPKLQSTICKDVTASAAPLGHAALQTLGVCLHTEQLVKQFTPAVVISSLCKTINDTSDKTTCTRALWCLAKQNLPLDALKNQLPEILHAIEQGQCKKNFQSLTVEFEALCAITRLLELIPDDMEPHAPRWGKLVYPLLLHDAPKIRAQALVAMETGMGAMVKHREDLIGVLVSDLKSLLVSQMSKLMANKVELHVLKVWCLYIRILGKTIHHGNLINTLLPIVEQGFKNSSQEVKVAAYQAWKALMENFALNKEILCDQKRVKLLMQVFKINNAKFESVAMEKQSVWWHLTCLMREGASLYFDQVVVPLLQFSFCGHVTSSGTTPGKTPSRGPALSKLGTFKSPATPLSGSLSSSPHTYTVVQHKGCEILAYILGKGSDSVDNPRPLFTIDAPYVDIITGVGFFTKHAVSIVGAVRLCLTTLGDQIEDSLLHHIWFCTVAHVKNMLECAPKRDSVDVFQAFLNCYREVVEEQALAPAKLLKLLEAVICLPANVLYSSSYSVGTSTTVMQSNACQFLMRCLFHHRILETSSSDSLFFSIFGKLVSLEFSHESSALGNAQHILEIVEQAVTSVDSSDTLTKMWTAIINPLITVILKTNEINQGTHLEHDFSCALKCLMLPVSHVIGSKLSQTSQTALLKLWSKLYSTISRVAALVNTAPANTVCKEICGKMLHACTEAKLQDEVFVASLSQMLNTVLESVEFSSLGSEKQGFGFGASLSPANLGHRRPHYLHNLSPLVSLTDKLLQHVVSVDSQEANDLDLLKKPKSNSASVTLQSLLQVVTTLFTHLPTSNMIAELVSKLGEPLGSLYQALARKKIRGVTQPNMQKAERLWQDIATAVQGRYSGPYDSEFLHSMAPLLAATFLHPRQKLKGHTMMLWNGTFAHSSSLTYPDSLKPVLAKVKDKSAIILPGWNVSEVIVAGETPDISMISQPESQAPLPNLVGITSPHKTHGTFLNKVVPSHLETSPLKPTMSPLKQAKSPKPTEKSKKKLTLNINDLRDDDFVVIKTSPKKKHILTSHQKEVLQEKSTIPALYSVVDASQDVSLMSKFNTESQMSQMSQSFSNTPTPTPITEIMPFPFSSLTKKQDSLDKKQINGTDVNGSSDVSLLKDNHGNISAGSTNRRKKSVQFAKVMDGKENISEDDMEVCSELPENVPESIVIQDSENSEKMSDKIVEIIDSEEKMNTEGSEQNSASLLTPKTAQNKSPTKTTNEKVPDSMEVEVSSSQASTVGDFLSPNSHFLQSKPESVLPNKLADVQTEVTNSPRRSGRRASKVCTVPVDANITKEAETPANESVLKRGRGRPPKRRNSLLEGLTQELATDAESLKQTKAQPQILAEDTQQMSPPSESITAPPQRTSEQSEKAVIEETPAKDDTVISTGNTDSCSKNLFGDVMSRKTEEVEHKKSISLVDYSETQPETEAIPSSQSFSPDVIPSSQPASDVIKEEPRTPTKLPSLDLSRLTMSPVVAIERLSKDIKLSGSPRQGKYTRLKDISDVSDSTDGPDSGKQLGMRRRRSCRQVSSAVKDEKSDGATIEKSDDAIEGIKRLASSSSVESLAVESGKVEVPSVSEQNSLEVVQETQPEPASQDTQENVSQEEGDNYRRSTTRGRRKKSADVQTTQENVANDEKNEAPALETVTETNKDNVFIVEVKRSDIKDPFSDTTQDCEVDLTDTQGSQHLTQSGEGKKDSGQQNKEETSYTKDNVVVGDKDSDAEPMDCESIGPSPVAETPRTRYRKPPHWLKDMDTSGSKKKVTTPRQNEAGSQSATRVSRRRSLRMVTSSQESEGGTSSKQIEESQENRTSRKEPAEKNMTPKPDEQSEELFTEKINEEPAVTDTPMEMSETPGEPDSLPQEQAEFLRSPAKEKQSSCSPLKVKQAERPDKKASKLVSDSEDDDVPLLSLSVRSQADDEDEANKMASSQESEGFPMMDSEPRQELKTLSLDKSVEFHSSDDEPLSQLKTSTPARGRRRSTPGSARRRQAAQRESPGSRLKKQLSINMHSPTSRHDRALRSKGSRATAKAKTLNRSIDSIRGAQERRRQLKAKRTKVTKDDSQLESQVQENSFGQEKESSDTTPETKQDKAEEVTDPDLTQDYNPSVNGPVKTATKELEEKPIYNNAVTVMKSMESAGSNEEAVKPKFVSPLRSPPRKGKLFNLPETPPSHSKHTLLSRASLILQRAKMVKPANNQPPAHRGRGPITAVPKADSASRPGILKSPRSLSPSRPGVQAAKQTRTSPPSGTFCPINLPRIYSPSASPSAGILRKRKLSGDTPTNSPSPPSKQRRVCFNETIETKEIPSAKKKPECRSGSRLVGRGSPKPVNRCLDMPQNQGGLPPSPLIGRGTSRITSCQERFITSTIPKARTLDVKDPSSLPKPVTDSQLSPTQNTIQSSGESELDPSSPIFPELVGCEDPIDSILPQLTSSMWSSGLGQLVRSMNISTVGDLAARSELEVHSLPIKSPKVDTVRAALQAVLAQRGTQEQSELDDENPLPPRKSLESLEDALSKISPADPSGTSDPKGSEPHDLLDEIRRLDDDRKSTPPTSPSKTKVLRADVELINALKVVEREFSIQKAVELPSSDLLQVYTNLSQATTKMNLIMANLVIALKNKCDPSNSQT